MLKTSSKFHKKSKKSSKNSKGSKKGNQDPSNVAPDAILRLTVQQEHQEEVEAIVDSSSEA